MQVSCLPFQTSYTGCGKLLCTKIYQLCFTTLYLRAVFQRVFLTNSLKNWKMTFLKFSILILLFICLISLRCVNSATALSLQSRQSPITVSLVLMSNRCSISSPLVSLFGWRSYPQWIPGAPLIACSSQCYFSSICWLKFPFRTRACDHSWRKKASLTGSAWSDGLQ